MEHNNRIFGLDFFRATAILMVVFANAIYFFQLQSALVGQLASLMGFFGLEMFFVLSGFLLAKSILPVFLKEDFGWIVVWNFVSKKLLRIVPLYFLIVLINIAIASWMAYPIADLWKYFFFIQNFAKPIPAFFPESWGLPVIVFSMIAFPLLLLGFSRIVTQKRKAIVFPILTVGLIVLFLWTKWLYSEHTINTTMAQWDASLKTVAIFRFDSVFIGVLIGWVFEQSSSVLDKMKWALAGAGCVGIAFISVGVGYFQILIESHPTFWNIVYLPLVAVFLGCFLPLLSRWQAVPGITCSIVTFISKISYAVYLVHFSIVLLLMEHFLVEDYTATGRIATIATGYILLTIIVGTALFYGIQKPLLKRMKR